MSWTPDAVDRLCVNTIRTLSIDAVQKANSGHPGLPLGAAPMAYTLWQRHLKFDPAAPDWPDRDRFVLSAGHGSMLNYALLHLAGYDLPLDEIKNFRQWGSKTPGHPEYHHTPGVEATTGPLGQGTAVTVGMAMAEKILAAQFNDGAHRIFDHHTFALVSDGDLMEGLSSEAASLAGHLRLGKLTYLYDANDISLDGPLDLAFTEDVGERYRSFGWQVLRVEDGDEDLASIDAALAEAREDRSRPSLILVKTTIGFGSPNKSGKSDAHGSPLGDDEVRATKEALGWDPDAQFLVPDEVRARFGEAAERGARRFEDWKARYENFTAAKPNSAQHCALAMSGQLPAGWDEKLPTWNVGDKLATRVAGGEVLQAVAEALPQVVGGDADLSCSTKTRIKSSGDFHVGDGSGRNIRYGVREHAMGSISNGIAYHGGLRPYTATFLVFSDYMRPAIRLASLDSLPVTFVFTHDSLGVGEDGPTHQPVEHVTALRAIPNLHVIRPGDPNEASAAWRAAMMRTDGPTVLVFTRQGLPTLEGTKENAREGVDRGGYVLYDPPGDAAALIIGTGSELSLAMGAAEKLGAAGTPTRVVSMPCREKFDAQVASYRERVLPAEITARVSVEAGVTLGWQKYVGDRGRVIGTDQFGASAPGGLVLEKRGFTVDAVVEAVKAAL